MSDEAVRLDRKAEGFVREALACAGLSGADEDARMTDLLPRPAQREAFMSAVKGQLLEETGRRVVMLALVLFDGETRCYDLVEEFTAFLHDPDRYLADAEPAPVTRRAVVRGIRREAARRKVRPTIIEALENPRLLGALPEFRDLSSWRGWLVVLKAFYGLELDPEDRAWLSGHTGRSWFDPKGYWTLVVSVGRQAGKTTIVSAVADYEAIFADPDLGGDFVICVGQDFRGAVRGLFSKIAAPFETVAAFKPLLAKPPGADALALASGLTVAAYPCRPQAIRGPSSRMTLLDEAAWLRSSEGVSQDQEMLRAIEPGLAMGGATVDGRRRPGRLVLLSSPAGESGMFYDLFTKHWARDDSPVLVVQASAMAMNRLLPADYMERMREDDWEGYQAEALGLFRGGQSALLDPTAVRSAVQKGRVDLPPVAGVVYVGHLDASSGRNDHYVLAIGHRDGDRIVVDLVRSWKAGANFSTRKTAAEAAALLKDYGVREVTGDGYALGFVMDDFKAEGIEFRQIEKPGVKPDTLVSVNTSELMLDLVNPMHSGLVLLPDSAELVSELISLERRRSTVVGVHDRVVCPPGRKKDQATAVSGVVYRLRSKAPKKKMLQGYGGTAPATAADPDRLWRCRACGLEFRDPEGIHRTCKGRQR